MLVLAFRIELMMGAIIEVLIVDTYQCTQQENVKGKQKMILLTVGNYDSSKTIVESIT